MIVLHAIGGGSIPPEGTIMVRTIPHRKGSAIGDNRQGAEQVCKTSLGRFDSYWPHNWTFGIAGAYASLKN